MTIMTIMTNDDEDDDDMERTSRLTGDLNKMTVTHGA